jgi:hypothetical protein
MPSFVLSLVARPGRLTLYALTLAAALGAGCSSEPPPPDKASIEQGIKELNEQRDREWNNK